MGSIRDSQWKKSYMLEFLKNGEVEECFTFAVPPESEDFQFPQRVSETKTFSGSVFEDYGNDTYKIVLSGATINEEKKYIYKGSKEAAQYLTGTEEIFSLQEIIKNWNADTSDAEKKVYLYDLSKTTIQQDSATVAGRNWWRVFITSLKVKRDKSNPHSFKYTLEMSACEEDAADDSSEFPTASEISESVNTETESLSPKLTLISDADASLLSVQSASSEMEAAWQTD